MRRNHLLAAAAVSLMLLGAIVVSAQPVQQVFLPALSDGRSIPDLPPPDEASARLTVPEGFAVRLFAEDLNAPRLMTVGPQGVLYVAERGAQRIVRVPDSDNDGRADAVIPVATNLPGVHNMQWFEGALYAAQQQRIVRLQDQNNDGDMDDNGERMVIIDDLPCCGGHTSRTLHFGPDGKLYVAAGSESNNNPEGDPQRAAIMRYNPDGSIPADNPFADDPNERRRAVWAEGLRNSVDFIFTDQGALWATHNGSDGLGNDTPPEEIVIAVEPGKHYGWPYCYTPALGAVPAGTQEVPDQRVNLNGEVFDCTQATPALFTDLAHAAPLGITQYRAEGFPEDYQGDLFVAYHGSWNADQTPRDCRVARVIVADGQPVQSEAFLTGFRDNPQQECGGAWGRPAGVVVGAMVRCMSATTKTAICTA